MRLLCAFFTVFFSLMASGSLLSIALKTYGLNPHGNKLSSALMMLVWVAVATTFLALMPPRKPE